MSEDRAELTRKELLANEELFLRGVLEVAEANRRDIVAITISRGGQPKFTFRIRRMNEDELERAARKYVRYERGRNGIMVPDTSKLEMAMQRSMEIYEATLPEDRAFLWDNPTVQEAVLGTNCTDLAKDRRGAAVVDKLLWPKEKDAVIEAIEGAGAAEIMDLAKN